MTEEETDRRSGIKGFFIKILAVVAIVVIIFSPYLLILDFRKYLPFVITVWVISAAYFMFVKVRKDNEEKESGRGSNDGQ